MNRILLIAFALLVHSYLFDPRPLLGQVWQTVHYDEANDSPDRHILGLHFDSPTHGFALTSFSLLETTDSGRTWMKRAESDDDQFEVFQSFFSWDASHILIVGTQKCAGRDTGCGLIWVTSDAGRHWEKRSTSIVENILNVQFCSQKIGWAVGISVSKSLSVESIILRSTDGGQTWKNLYKERGVHKNLVGVACFDSKEIIAARSDGVLLYTRNAGASWQHVNLNISSSILRLRIFSGQSWVVGTDGIVLKSDNRGTTWKSVPLKTKDSLFDILILGKRGWLVGSNGALFSSSDGGANWNLDSAGISSSLSSISANDASVWAGGEKLTVLRLDLSK